ncbi:MAG: nucleotidyl transferase AbiEii/AbiGii toxin family protein [Gemmatimonadales bacterium]
MASPPSPDFAALLAELTAELAQRKVPFMVIGGQAVLLHGRPRLTDDIDLTLGADPGRIGTVLEACTSLGLQPLPEHPDRFVQQTFVLPARHTESRIRVDFIFSTTPYERQAIDRALRVTLAGVPVPFATAEDLLVHKLFAGRARDLEDAAGVVRRKGEELDWEYVRRWVAEFAGIPGQEGLAERLRRLEGETK